MIRPPQIQQHARTWMAFLLVLSDCGALFLAGLAAVGLRMAIGALVNPPFYWTLVPMIGMFLTVYALRGLYPAVGLSPVEELRRLSVSTSAVFLIITAYTFWARTAEYYSRLIFLFAFLFTLLTVPLGRWLLRVLAVNLGVWGEPVAVIGYGPQGQRTVEYLLRRMRFGIRPVVIVNGLGASEVEAPLPVVHLTGEEPFSPQIHFAGIRTAILIASELPEALQHVIVNEQRFGFRRFIVISDHSWIGSLGVTPYDLEGLLGLEVRQNLLNPWEQRLKRAFDVAMSLCLSLLALPIIGLIGLLIRLDSRGGVFYRHRRIGKRGREINVWKFRTMIQGADHILEQYLAENSEASEEWRMTKKLKRDPRVTRTGRFLRKTSLDELPQLWNVLKGEMSLVGPRPIIPGEIPHYQKGYALYQRVSPGITGLWQVSGRTETSYDDRVRYDEYYVRNWSIWLDLYILLRTVWVVLSQDGAY